MGTVLATAAIVWTATACAHNPAVAVVPGKLPRDIGELRIDVREETRLTEGVAGASVELVAASSESWQTPLRHVVADTAGRAVIAGLAPARYAIRIWAMGHDTVTQRISVKGGEILGVRVAIRDDRCTVVVTDTGPVCM